MRRVREVLGWTLGWILIIGLGIVLPTVLAIMYAGADYTLLLVLMDSLDQ